MKEYANLYNLLKYQAIQKSNMDQHQFSKPFTQEHIRMKITTWNKDSHGLFDYQTSPESYSHETYFVNSSISLLRNIEEPVTKFQSTNNQQLPLPNFESIATLNIQKNEINKKIFYKLEPKTTMEFNQENHDPKRALYKSLRGKPQEILKPGNIIKLGRAQFKVIQLRNNQETFTVRNTKYITPDNKVFDIKENPQINPQNDEMCRICLQSQQTKQNPLISPCLCIGTVSKIHLQCLNKCIDSKMRKQINEIVITYNFTKFSCELCQHPYPRTIKLNQQYITMMTIQKPQKPYILIQSLNSLSNPTMGKQQKLLYLLCPKIINDSNTSLPIRIGRAYHCEIRLNDISVSRSHAQISLKDGNFYLKDTKSKFGTLIKLDQIYRFATKNSYESLCRSNVMNIGNPKYVDGFRESFETQTFQMQFGRSMFQIDVIPANDVEIDTEGEGKPEDE